MIKIRLSYITIKFTIGRNSHNNDACTHHILMFIILTLKEQSLFKHYIFHKRRKNQWYSKSERESKEKQMKIQKTSKAFFLSIHSSMLSLTLWRKGRHGNRFSLRRNVNTKHVKERLLKRKESKEKKKRKRKKKERKRKKKKEKEASFLSLSHSLFPPSPFQNSLLSFVSLSP